MSEWPASHRYELAPAPGSLGLVQDFLNTVGIQEYGPDLLADTALAQAWATDALGIWSELRGVDTEPPALNDADLAKLRALRDTVAELLAGRQLDGRGLGGSPRPSRYQIRVRCGWCPREAAGAGWPRRCGVRSC